MMELKLKTHRKFMIVDFRDSNGHADLWTASKSNKTFQEYYLSQLEYSLCHVDLKPDKSTGAIEIFYRSDPCRRHRLLSDGGYIGIKVKISAKGIAAQGLTAGLSFESEISFHKLTIRYSDSKLGVGLLLFSDLSLSPAGDFLETTRLVQPPSPSKREGAKFLIPDGAFTTLLESSLNRTPVLFHASSLAHLKPGEKSSTPVLVLAGPRFPILKSKQRHRLRHSLAKALYGEAFSQQFQKSRHGGWSKSPIGIRMQHFSFSVPGQQMADNTAWSVTLTMEGKEKPEVLAATQSNQSTQALYHWGLFLLKWLSSFPM
ncbi:unnamed protein product [Hydatigera taeniaeformis]|uniref:CUB domain-containing protein n=1 Tax=Hydatigena taeniaeformis TaxID=6205 RepID=A0A0R3WZX6_HYDTA|nr:unnamed protein product [Hydatigera taeniaeformis]